MEAEKPVGWTPPVLLLDYGRQSRLVTQDDVDQWLKLEFAYGFLISAILEQIPAERLRAYVAGLPDAV